MERSIAPTGGERELQAFSSQTPRSGERDRADGTEGLRLNHMHPQVWHTPAGRGGCSQTLPDPANVSSADVLLRARRGRWRNYFRQRRRRPHLGWMLVVLAATCLLSCKG